MKKLIRILLAAVALLGLILGALELNVYVEKQEYRLEYPALIQQYSREYSLDPYLVAAVIHCESGNRPEAESPKGAVGLMQIMPETGAWIGESWGWKALKRKCSRRRPPISKWDAGTLHICWSGSREICPMPWRRITQGRETYPNG